MQRAISVALFPFAVLRLRIIRNRERARLFEDIGIRCSKIAEDACEK